MKYQCNHCGEWVTTSKVHEVVLREGDKIMGRYLLCKWCFDIEGMYLERRKERLTEREEI